MKKRSIKAKLLKQELTIGSWITIGHPIVAEIMAKTGYDWLTIDMEHSAITLETAQDLIRIVELCGVTPLVRISCNDATLIKRVMDAGAHGIIVPMVNSREDAMRAVTAMKYPPHGSRGVGLARAQKYGQDFNGYRNWSVAETVVIVQVEHILAVKSLNEILRVDGVDGFIIGPYDLSASLGIPGDFKHPDFVAALAHVKKIAREVDALMGFHVIHPDVDSVREKMREGYKFLAHSLDVLFLGLSCKKSLEALRTKL